MSHEMETGALASAGGLRRPLWRREAPGPCRNCATPVPDRFCPACGQLAANFHRPVFSLITEGLADSFSIDGRIARTLPALLLRPGVITRNYLDGKRARYVPPFRLFLLSSLLFFAVFFGVGDRLGWLQEVRLVADPQTGQMNLAIGQRVEGQEPSGLSETRGPDGRIDPEKLRAWLDRESQAPAEGNVAQRGQDAREAADGPVAAPDGDESDAVQAPAAVNVSPDDILLERLAAVYDNQGEFFAAVRSWAPRVSLLLLPFLAVILAVMHFWRRRIYIYDHLITALHLQAFLYLLGSILILSGLVFGGGVGWIAAIWVPVYLFLMFRRTYGAGPVMAGLRTLVLLVLTSIALLMVVSGILVLGVLEV